MNAKKTASLEGGQCWVEGCNQRCGRTEVCEAHTWWAVWSDVADEHDTDDSWWHEQLADYETQVRQCIKATIAADWLSSRAAAHALALLAIKALHRLPLDCNNGNGGTWRDDLQTVVDIAFNTQV